MGKKFLNGLMFNLTWLLIVGGQGALAAWLLALLHVLVHMRFLGLGSAEWRFILVVTVFGLLFDQLLFASGLLVAPGAGAPLWLSALWPVLATTAGHVFSGLARAWWLASLVGAAGGVVSYRLGASLTDVAFGSTPFTDVALAGLWALLFPLLLMLGQRMTAREDDHALAP